VEVLNRRRPVRALITSRIIVGVNAITMRDHFGGGVSLSGVTRGGVGFI
jgi:hypothetical protein